MTREEIKKIVEGITDEQLNSILDINSADIGKAKKGYEDLKSQNETLTTEKKELEDKITELTDSAASAEEYKKQLETLKKEIKEKEEKAEADRAANEKAAAIEGRFGAVLGEKKFSHEAIKADYLKKFGEALENKDFQGKSDAEIFHELTKDDGAAFENVTALNLRGGADKGMGTEIDDAAVRAVMGLPPAK